jgi:predicted CXXCH cytochrome family protein
MRNRSRLVAALAGSMALAAAPAHAAEEKGAETKAEKRPAWKPAVPAPPKIAGAKADYAGSQACARCHAEAYESWKASFHARMLAAPKEGFLEDAWKKWETDGTGAGPTTGNATGARFQRSDVKYVVGGGKWKQRYLVANETSGGLQLMNRQFNRVSGKWEDYGQKNDWNTTCATCHTTGYRITAYDPARPLLQRSEWVEPGVGCEACHGPGARHVKSRKKADIWNVAYQPVEQQSRLCGYCHVRLENRQWKSAQGSHREDLPAPKVGDTFLPWQDWTRWYPEQVVLPGIQKEDPFDREYAGDLEGMFKVDDVSRADGVFEEARHHQQYQGFVQSAHFQGGQLSCITCHAPHGARGMLKKVPADACRSCHDETFTVERHMPNTGKTAADLFVKSHTFKRSPRASSGPGTSGQPRYYE